MVVTLGCTVDRMDSFFCAVQLTGSEKDTTFLARSRVIFCDSWKGSIEQLLFNHPVGIYFTRSAPQAIGCSTDLSIESNEQELAKALTPD